MMRILQFMFAFLLIASTPTLSQENQKLTDSHWVCRVTNANDSLLFTSNTDYVYFSSEDETHAYGFYIVRGDTVFLFQRYGEFDKEFPCGSEHREGKKLFKLLWQRNRLRMVFARHSIYDEPIMTFDPDYYFERVKKNP